MLNTLYEAEGLVEMAIRRNVEPDDRLAGLIVNKCYDIAAQGAAIDQSREPAQSDEQPVTAPPVYNEDAADEPKNDNTPDEELSVDEASEEEKAVEIFTQEVLPQIPEPADDIHDASIFDDSTDTPKEATDTPEEQSPDNENETPTDTEEAADNVPADEEEEEEDVEYVDEEDEEDYYEPDPVPVTEQHVPDNSPESKAKTSLMSFCSINDKFRFKRELFSNSDHQMRHTFSLIEQMDSADTVRRYCASDLHWDNGARVVKDFYTVIDRYFTNFDK